MNTNPCGICISSINKIIDFESYSSGDDGVEETLLSISNRKVKLYSANGTARETVWESRTSPGYYAPLAQLVEHLTLNQGVLGSSP
jgi:hypothetical protein